jgi:serine/threonine-protein kinase
METEQIKAQQWQRINDLFHSTLEREPGERAAFLAQACAGDESLRREVEALLEAHERVDNFFDAPAMEIAAGLFAQQMIPSLEGRRVGHYQVLSLIGTGGMGQIFLADDTRLKRQVAIKVLPTAFTADPDRIRRFEQEAHAASSLNHPNIVTIHEVGQVEDAPFIVTEFIEGKTLRRQMAAEKMTLLEALDVAIQMASALEAAHKAGIVHRDIKPENIMLRPDGLVKVLDFGLAKLTEAHSSAPDDIASTPARFQTKTGLVMGTVTYMSPEQARGLTVDVRSDVFSLGTVIYEMVAGQVPFDGATTSDVIVSILEREPAPLSRHAPEVPAELERIVMKALAKDSEERYQVAKDLLIDLRNLKQEMELQARMHAVKPADPQGATPDALRLSVDTDDRLRARSADAEVARTVSSAEYLAGRIKTHKRAVAIGLAALLTAIAAIVYLTYFTRGAAIDSVAVLPFINVSGALDAEYLSEGISDSTINSLRQVPGIKRVIALNSVMRYKGQQVDPQTIGREFDVQAVLMGRLTQRGDDLGISVELVDVRDNRQLWGEQYNRKLSDILVVQREIAQQISSGLRLQLSGKEKQQIVKQYTENPNAEIAYLKGRYLHNKRRGQDTQTSIDYLKEAIRLDSNYALAYTTLADAYLSLATLGSGLQTNDVLPMAKDAVDRALAIDDTLAEAHAGLASIRLYAWDWSGAEREFKRASELNPNYKPVNANYEQYLVNMKRSDEAVAESKRVLELDPVSVHYNRNLAMILYFARRYDEAIEQCQKTLELDPSMQTTYNWLWRAYGQKGLYDQAVEAYLKSRLILQQGPEAVTALRRAYAKSRWKGFWREVLDFNIERANRGANLNALAENFARLGEKDQALLWLEKGIEQRNVTITLQIRNPFWDSFRSDARFANLVRRMGLEP